MNEFKDFFKFKREKTMVKNVCILVCEKRVEDFICLFNIIIVGSQKFIRNSFLKTINKVSSYPLQEHLEVKD